jgi:hypothetical protein
VTNGRRDSDAAPAEASGRTLHVGPTGYPSIGEAIANASPLDNIVVEPGEYRETGLEMHGTQTLVGGGDDRDGVTIVLTQGTIHLSDQARVERLTISRPEDEGDEAILAEPLVQVGSGAPALVDVSLSGVPGEVSVDLAIVGGRPSAVDSQLGTVAMSGASTSSLEDCELEGLRVAGAFPSLRSCTVYGETVVSDAGGGTFVACALGMSRSGSTSSFLVGLDVRDAGSHPVLSECAVAGGYRAAIFWRGGAGDLDGCELRTLWAPGRLAVAVAKWQLSAVEGLADSWMWWRHDLPADAPALLDLVWRAARIDPMVLMKGLPVEVTPARFFEPSERPVLAIRDRYTSPRLMKCRLLGPSPIELDPDSSPALLDYQWTALEPDPGWRAMVPPTPTVLMSSKDSFFASTFREWHEQALLAYLEKVKGWAALREAVDAGEYDEYD